MTKKKPPKKEGKKPKPGTSKASAANRKAAFIEAYITNGGNGLQAAVAAGYSKKGAGTEAWRLLKDPQVSSGIAKRQAEVEESAQAKTGLTIEGVLRELAAIVHHDPRKLVDENGVVIPLHKLDDASAAALASIEVLEEYEGRGDMRVKVGETKKVKFWDKNSAIEKAMKHFGMFEKDNAQAKTQFVVLDAADQRA